MTPRSSPGGCCSASRTRLRASCDRLCLERVEIEPTAMRRYPRNTCYSVVMMRRRTATDAPATLRSSLTVARVDTRAFANFRHITSRVIRERRAHAPIGSPLLQWAPRENKRETEALKRAEALRARARGLLRVHHAAQ